MSVRLSQSLADVYLHTCLPLCCLPVFMNVRMALPRYIIPLIVSCHYLPLIVFPLALANRFCFILSFFLVFLYLACLAPFFVSLIVYLPVRMSACLFICLFLFCLFVNSLSSFIVTCPNAFSLVLIYSEYWSNLIILLSERRSSLELPTVLYIQVSLGCNHIVLRLVDFNVTSSSLVLSLVLSQQPNSLCSVFVRN